MTVDSKRNDLLSAVPAESIERLLAGADVEHVTQGSIVIRSGEEISHLLFPLDAVLAHVSTDEEGRTTEAAMIGNRSAAGLGALLPGAFLCGEVAVKIGGGVLRIPVAPIRVLFESNPDFRTAVLAAVQETMIQLYQNVSCHRLHSIEQRYSRWLLELEDCSGRAELPVTQITAAAMLGVRRAGVTDVANLFERKSMIVKRRGKTVLTDRPQLEQTSCGCYVAMRRMYEKLSALQGPVLRFAATVRTSGSVPRAIPASMQVLRARHGW